MNNDNFAATHPRTVVRYGQSWKSTVIGANLKKLLIRISEEIFLRDSVRKPKYS